MTSLKKTIRIAAQIAELDATRAKLVAKLTGKAPKRREGAGKPGPKPKAAKAPRKSKPRAKKVRDAKPEAAA